jgi:hypothetical protein
MAFRVFRRLRDLLDVSAASPADNDSLTWDAATQRWVPEAVSGGGGGAPTGADYLVGTAQAGLSAEIVVGATPGGDLGGTWASPTVDATHSGSSHAGVQAAAEATAAAALSAHTGDTADAHDASAISILDTANDFAATDVEGALAELQADAEADATALSDHVADTSAAHAASAISFTPAGTVASTTVQAAIEEVSGDVGSLSSVYQPLDSDLTAIAALTTTAFGRALLALVDQAALLAAAGAAAASHAHSGGDITSGTVADARIDAAIARDSEVTSAIAALSTVYQPLDSDLTSIAALTTTSFGRSLLALADAAALLAAAGAAAASHSHAESDVTGLTTDLAAKIPKTVADANSVLYAVTDDTPAALAMGASTIVARLAAGNIVAATPAELKTLLGGFMTITEYASGTETVSTSEWSLTTDTSGPDVQTDDGEYQFFFDLNALAKGDVFQFAVYEKVISGGTQRVVFKAFMANAQSSPIWVSPKLILLHGWDATLLKVSGTDHSIDFSVRRIAAS